MKFYRCDHCTAPIEANEPIVRLNGIRETEKHFCSATCFWTWAESSFPVRVPNAPVEVE